MTSCLSLSCALAALITGTGTLALPGTNACAGGAHINAGGHTVTHPLTGASNRSVVTVPGKLRSRAPGLTKITPVRHAFTPAATTTSRASADSPGGTAGIVDHPTFKSTREYASGSIFDWQLASNAPDLANSGPGRGPSEVDPEVPPRSFKPAADTPLFWNARRFEHVFGAGPSGHSASTGCSMVIGTTVVHLF
jgi:hypothetical protein